MIKLQLPLKYIYVTQKFGKDFLVFDKKLGKYNSFYNQFGLKGHNGIDFRTKDGCICYATHGGIITKAVKDTGFGNFIELFNDVEKYKTRYGHLKNFNVKVGDIVKAGDKIAECDNTGKYTTGHHLHFDVRETYENGAIANYNNEFNGAINPSLYFNARYDGKTIVNKDWDKSRCYHRYDRGRPKGGLWIEKYRVVPALTKYLRRLPSNEDINACVYGGWEREVLKNPAMYELYSNLKKDEFKNNKIPYLDN